MTGILVHGIRLYSARQVAEETGAHVMHVRAMANQGRIGFMVDSTYVFTDECVERVRNRRQYGTHNPRKDGRVVCADCGKLRKVAKRTIESRDQSEVKVALCATCAEAREPVPA